MTFLECQNVVFENMKAYMWKIFQYVPTHNICNTTNSLSAESGMTKLWAQLKVIDTILVTNGLM